MDYRHVPIEECGEPLQELPVCISRVAPHPYARLGAPYGRYSPFMLRSGVLARLLQAQNLLHRHHSDLNVHVFDAYRPVAVQQFMVEWTFKQQAARLGLSPENLTQQQRSTLYTKVYQFWALPSHDPATPPPHSTGAAVDLTLMRRDQVVEMGSPIDEISERSYPDYFGNACSEPGQTFHHNRVLLRDAMREVGFNQHAREWWHFSYGDQMWAAAQNRSAAHYGPAVVVQEHPRYPHIL